ncbi:MAG: ABC transporter permease [Candidatus Micrarchaeota archaeon]
MQYDLMKYAVDGLMRRGLRSWLTVIGIVIGVVAIVLLIALGQGIDVAVKQQLAFFGSDAITLAPSTGGQGGGGGFLGNKGKLTEKDWLTVKKISGVEYASPVLQGLSIVEFKGDESQLFLMGFTEDFAKIYKSSTELDKGRGIKNGDKGVVVLGDTIANELWGTAKQRKKVQLGDRLIIQNKSYEVIGILKKSGGGLASVTDFGVYLSYEDARDTIAQYTGNDQLSQLDVKVKEGYSTKAVADEITRVLDNIHKIRTPDERDYRVTTSEQIQSIVGNVTGLLTAFLALIAAISLLVGSIGVANTMFMSVLERTREIGILKAVGADESVIRQIFILESGLIGMVGGVIGVIISYALAKLLEFIASLAGVGLPLDITPGLVIFAIGVSFVTGVLAGYFPARRAAHMNAVDSLRYE